MMLVELLTQVNNSYLVALGLLVCLIVEGIKTSEVVDLKLLPLVAALIGWVIGVVIALVYNESVVLASLNGIIVGLLAAGSFDFVKAVWQLPELFK